MITQTREEIFSNGESALSVASAPLSFRRVTVESAPAPAPAPAPASQVETDHLFAMPSGSAINSSVALTGSDYSPATPPQANDPGLNSTSVFQNTPAKGTSQMTSTHWLLIAVAIVAVLWALFHYGVLGSSATA